jgi:hypothetical protein
MLFLALGLTSLFGAAYVGQPVVALGRVGRPGAVAIPVLGPILFRHDPLTYLSLRARAADLVGALPQRMGPARSAAPVSAPRCWRPTATARRGSSAGAVVVGGMLAGLGGAQLSIAYANAWFENMTPGPRLHRRRGGDLRRVEPVPRVMGGAYLFGAAPRPGPALQARGYGINQFALDVIPYPLTIDRPLAVLGRRRPPAPEGSRRSSRTAPDARPHHLLGPRIAHQRRTPRRTPTSTRPLESPERTERERCPCANRTAGAIASVVATLVLSCSALRQRRPRPRQTSPGRPSPARGPRPSASSSWARRTTSATTRRPTRAARR